MQDTSIGYGTRELAREEVSPARQQHEAELARQARMRPSDKSPTAVQTALDAIIAEQAISRVRLQSRQDAVDAMQGAYHAPEKVQEALNLLELAQIDTEQFNRMRSGMEASLLIAKDTEAKEMRLLAENAKAAAATVARFRQFIGKDYPKLAGQIAAGLALEREAETALRVLTAAATYLPGHDAPEPLPRVRNGALEEAYRYRMCLPGTPVQPQKL